MFSGHTLVYDAENRLVAYKQGSIVLASYTYDGDGTLVRKVVGGQTTVYVGMIYEKNLTTGVVTKYYYLDGQRVAMRAGSNVTWIHSDHLGSASLTTNASGAVAGEMRYYPYGQTRWGTVGTDRRYTGQREEVGLGLYDYGARYYDPVLARWISPDSIIPEPGNPQSLNRFSYVLGNPLKYVDPTGHFSEEQLNWLGYYRDDLDESIWSFLLALQPGDELFDVLSERNAGTLGLTQRETQSPGQGIDFGLYVFHQSGEATELLQWLGDNLRNTFAFRDTPDGNELIWSADGAEGLWSTPLKQGGYIQTELGAMHERFMQTVVVSAIVPLVFPAPVAALAVDLYLDISQDPGSVRDDINMTFTYYDAANDLYYTRSMWLRYSHSAEGPMQIVSDTWYECLQGGSTWNTNN